MTDILMLVYGRPPETITCPKTSLPHPGVTMYLTISDRRTGQAEGRPKHRAAIALFLAVGSSGCAPMRVPLGYGTLDVNPPAPKTEAGQIAVARFDDARSSEYATGDEIGQMRNLYGMPVKKIEGSQNPVLWVSGGLVNGLAAEGFTVERVESAQTAGALPTVVGKVSKVFVDTYMAQTAWVDAEVGIDQRGVRLFSTSCSGEATQTGWWGTEEEYRSILALAMENFLKACVPKLTPILSQYAAK